MQCENLWSVHGAFSENKRYVFGQENNAHILQNDRSRYCISPNYHSPYFTTIHFLLQNYDVNQQCPGPSRESHHEKSLELSYLTSDTCPLMCDNSFQTSLSPAPAPQHPPSHHLFFYTKIHESLASGVTEGWIKVILLPSHPLKSPQFSQISLTEGIIHPRSYTTEPRKVKLMGWIHNFLL